MKHKPNVVKIIAVVIQDAKCGLYLEMTLGIKDKANMKLPKEIMASCHIIYVRSALRHFDPGNGYLVKGAHRDAQLACQASGRLSEQ